jgi:hypothetical protein
MEVTDTPVNLGKLQCLIQNVSGDPIHVGEYGQDEADWFEIPVGSAVTVKAYNNGVGVVSDGVSEVGILVGGTGIFPPAVDAPDLSGYQPLDSDLTAIAALATTAYGRALLTLADQAALGASVGTEVFKQVQTVNAQTGTSYTLVAGDAGKLVTLDNAGAITLTLPQDSDATIPVGTYVDLYQLGAGQVTVQAGSGATLRVSGLTAKARAQYSRFSVQKVSANTWSLGGDLASS